MAEIPSVLTLVTTMERALSRSLLNFQLLSDVSVCLEESCSKWEEVEESIILQYFCKWWRTERSSIVYNFEKCLSSAILKLLFPQIRTYGKFPYQEGNIGNWFQERISIKGDHFIQERQINILNLLEKPKVNDRYPLLNETDFPDGLEEDGYVILYHGTEHESAKNIVEKGIRLDQLNKEKAQDFSFGKGFYLTKTYEGDNGGAVTWAFRNFDKRRSVLIFKIPCSTIDEFREDSKSFVNDDKGLKEFVKMYRIRDEKTNPRQLKTNLRNTSFVEGAWVKLREKKIIPIQDSYQICLHSEELAENFNQYLHSVIFFS